MSPPLLYPVSLFHLRPDILGKQRLRHSLCPEGTKQKVASLLGLGGTHLATLETGKGIFGWQELVTQLYG